MQVRNTSATWTDKTDVARFSIDAVPDTSLEAGMLESFATEASFKVSAMFLSGSLRIVVDGERAVPLSEQQAKREAQSAAEAEAQRKAAQEAAAKAAAEKEAAELAAKQQFAAQIAEAVVAAMGKAK
jgi:membrane protein involved in colicin uptake